MDSSSVDGPAGPAVRFVRVEVATRPGQFSAESEQIRSEIRRLLDGADDLEVRTLRGFALAIAGDQDDWKATADRVLVDPVLEEAVFLEDDEGASEPEGWTRLEVVRRAGVMDPVTSSTLRAFAAIGHPIHAARTYRVVLLRGGPPGHDWSDLARKLLANEVVEELRVGVGDPVHPSEDSPDVGFQRVDVPLEGCTDEELQRISREGMLALDLGEMKTVAAHFQELGRPPTDVELETIAQTWSEHCKHKTLTSSVELPDRSYDNLLKDTIFASTTTIAREDCLSVFKDNAGAIAFDDETAVTFKVETHNHPSALEPYGGAGTGIGGVLRDTMGTGLGARPVVSTDVFCVGPMDLPEDQLPPGTLHPRRILQGVVAGVRDYGNRMGIPTANGAVFVHPDYRTNPLVFAGNVGIIPREMLDKEARPGDRIFVLGGRTGRDGIHGATFSSEELDTTSEEVAGGAVQIGNPIEEKRLLDACMEARDRGFFRAVTDCGAGGLSSAIGEMGEPCGADVELAKVPLKYHGLTAGEIWISEAQERMVAAVPADKAEALFELCRIHDVEATDLGEFTDSGRLKVSYDGNVVVDLSMEFLHDGVPKPHRKANPHIAEATPEPTPAFTPGDLLLDLLRHPDITSKEEICRQYDHEVLAGSAIKPMAGPGGYGPSDACVHAPRLGSLKGIAVGCGMSPTLGRLDAYQMALHSIDEAVRNVISVGSRFDRIALLDNFAWDSVQDEESLGGVVLACEACRDAALAWNTPFISGKDSLNNQMKVGDEVIRIPPTLLISALTLIDRVSDAVSMDLKATGNPLVLVGVTQPGLAGSRACDVLGADGGSIPTVDLEKAKATHIAVGRALATGAVRSCHDLSEGGLAVAAAEMCLAGGIGARIDIASTPVSGEVSTLAKLFGESPTRYLLEVTASQLASIRDELGDIPHTVIGETTDTSSLEILADGTSTKLELAQLTTAFRTGLGLLTIPGDDPRS